MDLHTLFQQRVHPALYAALKLNEVPENGSHPPAELCLCNSKSINLKEDDTACPAPEEGENKSLSLIITKPLHDFLVLLQDVLWEVLLFNVQAINTESAAAPIRLPYAAFLAHLVEWERKVLGCCSPSSDNEASTSTPPLAADDTEQLFVHICATVLLYSARFRHKLSETLPTPSTLNNLPASIEFIAKLIPVAVFSLEHRCEWPSSSSDKDYTSPEDQSRVQLQVRDLLEKLWFHFLFTFVRQLMCAFSVQENEAWTKFCHSCLQESISWKTSISPFSNAFLNTEDGAEEETAIAKPDAVDAEILHASVLSSSPPAYERLALHSKAARDMYCSSIHRWGADFPRLSANASSPQFIGELLSKSRMHRALLLSRAPVPHHLLQAPDTTFELLQALEAFQTEWFETLAKRIPQGTLSHPSVRKAYHFPTLEGERPCDLMTPFSADKDGFGGVLPTPSPLVEEAVQHLAALPRKYSRVIATLIGNGRTHLHLLVSVLISVLVTHYLDTSFSPRPVSSKNNSLLEQVQKWGQALLWKHPLRTMRKAYSLESLMDGQEARWRAFCPFGFLFCEASDLPIRDFLPPALLHIFSSPSYAPIALLHRPRGGPPHGAFEEQRNGKQRLALLCFFTGLTDLPRTLLMYSASFGSPPVHSESTIEPGWRAPTAALASFTAAVNKAVKAADMERLDVNLTASTSARSQSANVCLRSKLNLEEIRESDTDLLDDEEEVLEKGEQHARKMYALTFPIAIPSAMQWFLPDGGTEDKSSSSSSEALSKALAPLSFVIDLFLSHHVDLAADAIQHLQYDLAVPSPPALSSGAVEEPGQVASGSSSLWNSDLSWEERWGATVREITKNEPVELSGSGENEDVAVNLFLIPHTLALGGLNLQTVLLVTLDELLHKWEEEEDRAFAGPAGEWWTVRGVTQCRALYRLAPLLIEGSGYLRHVPTLHRLLVRLEKLCRQIWQQYDSSESPINPSQVRHVFGLAEFLILRVIIPALRSIPPSPVLHAAVYAVMSVWEEASIKGFSTSSDLHRGVVLFGDPCGSTFLHISEWLEYERFEGPILMVGESETTAATSANRGVLQRSPTAFVRRHPHEVLLFKEYQSLFLQAMKRIHLRNIRMYTRLLRPVFFSFPIHVGEKLIQQAVGYHNDFLPIHLSLIRSAPPSFGMLLLHRGLQYMRSAADKEQNVGMDQQRTTDIVQLLAAVCRVLPSAESQRALRLLLHTVENALRRYTRHTHVFALALLKAVLSECLGAGLAHEEHHNAVQREALAAAGPITVFFASGRAESFRQMQWTVKRETGEEECGGESATLRAEHGYSPLHCFLMRQLLLEVLHEPLPVPLALSMDQDEEEHGPGEGEEVQCGCFDVWDMEPKEMSEVRWRGEEVPCTASGLSCNDGEGKSSKVRRATALVLGHQLLLHLCQRHAQLQRLQADQEGYVEAIILANAKETDTILDMIFSLDQLLVEANEANVSSSSASLPFASFTSNVSLPQELVENVAIPTLALRLRCDGYAQRAHTAPPPLLTNTSRTEVVNDTASAANSEMSPVERLQSHLSFFTAAHLSYDAAPYQAALTELEAYEALLRLRTRSETSSTSYSESLPIPTLQKFIALSQTQKEQAYFSWCREAICEEQVKHERLFQDSDSARLQLLDLLKQHLVPLNSSQHDDMPVQTMREDCIDPVTFATEVLLPRLLFSAPDVIFVERLLEYLIVSSRDAPLLYKSILETTYSLITALWSFFVGFSSSECRRIGYLFSTIIILLQKEKRYHLMQGAGEEPVENPKALLEALQVSSMSKQKVSSSSRAVPSSSKSDSVNASTTSVAQLLLEVQTSLKAGAQLPTPLSYSTTSAGAVLWKMVSSVSLSPSSTSPFSTSPSSLVPSEIERHLLALEVYHIVAFLQLLRQSTDEDTDTAPAHTQRNALLVLEKLPLEVFPQTIACGDALARALRPHTDKSNPNSPSATAALRRLLPPLKQRREAKSLAGRLLLLGMAKEAMTTVDETQAHHERQRVREWMMRQAQHEQFAEKALQQYLDSQWKQQAGEDQFDPEALEDALSEHLPEEEKEAPDEALSAPSAADEQSDPNDSLSEGSHSSGDSSSESDSSESFESNEGKEDDQYISSPSGELDQEAPKNKTRKRKREETDDVDSAENNTIQKLNCESNTEGE